LYFTDSSTTATNTCSIYSFRGGLVLYTATNKNVCISNATLTVACDPTNDINVGNRAYNDARYLRADGAGAMTGNLNLNGMYISGDGASEGLYVNNTGWVGVQNSAPQAALDVNGTVRATDGRFENGVSYVAALGDLSMGSFTQD
jgi:hypothetical protein